MENKENNSYTYTQKIISQVVSDNDKETIKAITRYCEENNVYPNLISEERLKEVIGLGLKNERLQQENKELQQRFNSLLEAHKIQEELLDSKEYKLNKGIGHINSCCGESGMSKSEIRYLKDILIKGEN